MSRPVPGVTPRGFRTLRIYVALKSRIIYRCDYVSKVFRGVLKADALTVSAPFRYPGAR